MALRVGLLALIWLCGFAVTAAAQQNADDHYKDFSKDRLTEIQQLLIWTGDYGGSVDGFFGAGTLKAIEAYQLRNGSTPDGLLTEDQLRTLVADGGKEMKRADFQLTTDAATGISIGLPKAYITTEKPGKFQGTRYSSSDGGIQIETLKFTDPDQALPQLYEKLNSVKNRKITYSSFHDDWFALSGTTNNYDSRFYTRFTMKNNEIRGFSITYRTELNEAMFRVIVAMSNTFEPFPLLVAHITPDPSTLPPPNLEAPPAAPAQGGPEAPPPPGKAGTLSTATGFLISDDGWIVTTSSAVRNCDQILIGAYGEAKDVRIDSEAPVAAVRLQSVDVFVPLGLSTNVPSYMMKVSAIGFPNDDRLGQHPILTAGSFLSYAGSAPNPQYAQVTGLIQPGNEGGPLVDEEGKVIGVLVDKRTLLASLGSHRDLPDTVSYAVREEFLFNFLASNGIRPATRRPTGIKPEPGEIVEMAGKAIVPVVCVRR